MKRLMLLAALPFLAHAASAQASFAQELGSPLPVDTDPYDVVAADFNKDGRPDLAVANGTASTISILLRQPGGGFAQEGPSIPAGLGHQRTRRRRLQLRHPPRHRERATTSTPAPGRRRSSTAIRSRGFAQEPTTYCAPGRSSRSSPATSAATGSRTSPGAAASATRSTSTCATTGPGSRTRARRSPPAATRPTSSVADFNGDGKLDIASANSSGNPGSVSVFLRNATNNGFTSTAASARRAESAEARGGRTSTATARRTSPSPTTTRTPSRVLLGQGNGTFATAPAVGVGAGPIGITTGDFNRDGSGRPRRRQPGRAVRERAAAIRQRVRPGSELAAADGPDRRERRRRRRLQRRRPRPTSPCRTRRRRPSRC